LLLAAGNKFAENIARFKAPETQFPDQKSSDKKPRNSRQALILTKERLLYAPAHEAGWTGGLLSFSKWIYRVAAGQN
jgi:hypothetical protein